MPIFFIFPETFTEQEEQIHLVTAAICGKYVLIDVRHLKFHDSLTSDFTNNRLDSYWSLIQFIKG